MGVGANKQRDNPEYFLVITVKLSNYGKIPHNFFTPFLFAQGWKIISSDSLLIHWIDGSGKIIKKIFRYGFPD